MWQSNYLKTNWLCDLFAVVKNGDIILQKCDFNTQVLICFKGKAGIVIKTLRYESKGA